MVPFDSNQVIIMGICSVGECNNPLMAKGYCGKHYNRWRKKGSPTARTIRDPNEFVDYGEYWEIKLYDRKCNYIASAKIDPEDVEKCREYRWYLKKGYDNCLYVISDTGPLRIHLHRFVMDVMDPLVQVDHVYGDGLDNRKSQLRECNNAQNTQNQRVHKNNTSGVKNVNWCQREGKWQVEIDAFGKRCYFGRYKDFNTACQIAKIERRKLHKEFTRDK